MTDPAPVLLAMEDSHARLLDIVDQLGPDDLRTMSYCSAWTIADVLSHIGSGA
jgi:hypothetical protein